MQPSVRAGTLQGFGALIREYGLDPNLVYRRCGLDPGLEEAPETKISPIAVRRCLELAAKQTGRDDFALQLAARQGLRALGALGEAVLAAPNPAMAAEACVRFLALHATAAEFTLTQAGEDYVARFSSSVRADNSHDVTDLAVARIAISVRSMLGDDWAPRAVRLTRPRPSDPDAFNAFFKAQVHFGANASELWIGRDASLYVNPNANPILFRTLGAYLSKLKAQQNPSLRSIVYSIVRDELGVQAITLAHVARRMAITPRTLQRRLQAVGLSFSELIADVKSEAASALLSNTPTPVSEIAASLGYAETSAFSRAFKKRTGKTPSAWRTSGGETSDGCASAP